MLTEKIVRDSEITGKSYTVWDAKLRGFGLQVTRGGMKNYVMRYKTLDSKYRQAIIARCSEISLRDARARAQSERVKIRAGETDPLERKENARNAPTVNELLDRFFNEYAPARIEAGRLSEKTLHEYRLQSGRFRQAHGTSRVAKIRRRDIELFADSIDRPIQRNRTLAFLSRVFNLAELWEYRDTGSNPCRGVTRVREEARDRVLSASELSRLNEALSTMQVEQMFRSVSNSRSSHDGSTCFRSAEHEVERH